MSDAQAKGASPEVHLPYSTNTQTRLLEWEYACNEKSCIAMYYNTTVRAHEQPGQCHAIVFYPSILAIDWGWEDSRQPMYCECKGCCSSSSRPVSPAKPPRLLYALLKKACSECVYVITIVIPI